MKKPLAGLALLLTTILTLAACGTDDPADSAADGGGGGFNDADVSFAQNMIPHHEQAVQMAQLAEGRASSPEVVELAAVIEAAQAPEIEQMTAWLEEWREEVPSGSMEHGDMGHGESSGMPGMMDAEDMEQLETTSGPEWDEMFLTSMIEHHEGALAMARTEQANGENEDALALAEKVEADQEAEIATMEELLNS